MMFGVAPKTRRPEVMWPPNVFACAAKERSGARASESEFVSDARTQRSGARQFPPAPDVRQPDVGDVIDTCHNQARDKVPVQCSGEPGTPSTDVAPA